MAYVNNYYNEPALPAQVRLDRDELMQLAVAMSAAAGGGLEPKIAIERAVALAIAVESVAPRKGGVEFRCGYDEHGQPVYEPAGASSDTDWTSGNIVQTMSDDKLLVRDDYGVLHAIPAYCMRMP